MSAAILGLVIVQLLVLLLLVGVVYQLFQQQGRILLQMDAI